MIKKILLFLLAINIHAHGQIVHPAKWTFQAVEKKPGEAEIIFKVKLDKEWHMFSQFTPDGGPLPMVFTFDESSCYSRVGKVEEPKPEVIYDDVFGVDVHIFHHEVEFRQKVKVNSANCTIAGKIEYQVCKEVCIFMDTSFSVTLTGGKTGANPPVEKAMPVEKEAPVFQKIEIDSSTTDPDKTEGSIEDTSQTKVAASGLEPGCGNGSGDSHTGMQSLITIFIAGMLGGILALLTPCVFPMIPMTVSFFTKRSGSRRKAITQAIIYALSIMFIYVTLGLLVTVTLGSYALNELSSNAFFNLAFFVIFIIFAISFFGAFEITLPSWIVNKADSQSDKGGLIGIFFMAFTLSLVSFSCTGPIIGTLLVEAAQGQSYAGPLAGMTGFSFALAVPFAIFSLFPNWLNSLPRSGSWLNTVKVSLGFIELALALKFLSNVDLAYHWGFLKREIFICIWVIITLMLGFYLLGKIRLSHDNEVPHISTGRLLMSIIVFSFAIYMIPGIWGAPLKLISGFPPPEFYKEWTTGEETECPHGLNCFHDYEEGMKYAKAQGKPVMVDFTGWSCVNCRKMEDKVWSDPQVLKRLRDKYVLISLYVDDKKELPEHQQYTSPSSGKKIRTTGNKWSDFQATKYQSNSQPYYVLVDNDGRKLAEPRGGIIGIEDYVAFLDEGLCRYELRTR